MQHTLVMTVIGPDRPGLVEAIATEVRRHDGNWLESRMARLGGQFAGILRVQVPADSEGALTQALRGMSAAPVSRMDSQLFVKPLALPAFVLAACSADSSLAPDGGALDASSVVDARDSDECAPGVPGCSCVPAPGPGRRP